jgi:Ser/Thr protein kinase RdoA (MazF antagonist)
VPEVLEVRRGDVEAGLPGLLVTSRLAGERLELLLPGLDEEQLTRVGRGLGTLVGRLGHMAQPRPGVFTDRSLTLSDPPPALRDLASWLDLHAAGLGPDLVEGLRPVADAAQDLLEQDRRSCLVHSDLDATNLLVDPKSLAVTGVLDWESAHSGSPWTDLGNLVRFDRQPALVAAVVDAYRSLMPDGAVPADVLARARAADLFSLVELAAQEEENLVVAHARARLEAIAREGDPAATSGADAPSA